jgi:hypothetical protein
MDVQDAPLSTTSSKDVQGVFLPITSIMDVQGVSQSTYAGCTFLSMPECRTVRHLITPVPESLKMLTPEPVGYRDKRARSRTGMLRYRTKIQDVGILMPAASASIPMPSYG